MGTRSGASALVINSYAPELVPIIYYHDKTRVHMLYFCVILGAGCMVIVSLSIYIQCIYIFVCKLYILLCIPS